MRVSFNPNWYDEGSSFVQGGAYLTLLNTIANMGIILPKAPTFYLMDMLTHSACLAPAANAPTTATPSRVHVVLPGLACPRKVHSLADPSPCVDAGGTCVITSDGFFSVSFASLTLGLLLGIAYIRHLPGLMRMPLDAWRALSCTGTSRELGSGDPETNTGAVQGAPIVETQGQARRVHKARND